MGGTGLGGSLALAGPGSVPGRRDPGAARSPEAVADGPPLRLFRWRDDDEHVQTALVEVVQRRIERAGRAVGSLEVLAFDRRRDNRQIVLADDEPCIDTTTVVPDASVEDIDIPDGAVACP